jgi:hypothetical protein
MTNSKGEARNRWWKDLVVEEVSIGDVKVRDGWRVRE